MTVGPRRGGQTNNERAREQSMETVRSSRIGMTQCAQASAEANEFGQVPVITQREWEMVITVRIKLSSIPFVYRNVIQCFFYITGAESQLFVMVIDATAPAVHCQF